MATCMEEVLSPFDKKLVIAKSNWSHVSYEHKEPAVGLVQRQHVGLDQRSYSTLGPASAWVGK